MKKLLNNKFSLVLIVLCFILSGCKTQNKKSDVSIDHLIILIGAHSNFPKVSLSYVKEDLMEVVVNEGTVELIVVDGDPYIASTINVPENGENLSSTKRKKIAESYVNQIIEFSETLQASTPEVDLLSALILASEQLNGNQENGKIVVIDSCLQTKAPLNLSTLLLEELDTDVLIEALKTESYIPDLNNVSVEVIGLGNVVSPQEKLTPKNKKNLKVLWNEILLEAGANVKIKDNNVTDSNKTNNDKLPEVSTVPVSHPKDISSLGTSNYVSLDETVISFNKNSAVLKNRTEAEKNLKEISTYLKKTKTEILLIGCTAKWGSKNGCIQLSKDRALVVKELLQGLGVDPNLITVVGTGFENPFYQNDIDKNGNLVEEIAVQNRKVVLINKDTPVSKEILDR